MKISKVLFAFYLLSNWLPVFSQDKTHSAFKSDMNKSDIVTVLKTVADWQIMTPLTHDPADWTNGALYAGMVQWAAIAGDDKYYEWLREKSGKNGWTHMTRKEPQGKYIADDYCVGQAYIELYRKYKDKKMIKPMR
jgi:unsaturated rhamnogalacturonyl hydrolase